MLTELLEHDHGQQAGPSPTPGDHVERRRRLADLLAVPAGKLLPHGLDHLPLTGYRFQRARHVLAKFAQTIAATACTRCWRIDHHALAGQMVRECIALGALARKSTYRGYLGDRLLRRKFIFLCTGLELFECERQLIDQPRRTFRSPSIDLTLQHGNPQFLLGNQGCIFGRFRARHHQRLFQGSDVIGNGLGRSIHNNDRIINAAI